MAHGADGRLRQSGTAYCFRGDPLVQGRPSSGLPDYLWATFGAAVFVFPWPFWRHFLPGANRFPCLSGILILLTPVAALRWCAAHHLLKIGSHHHLFRQPQVFLVQGSPNLHTEVLTSGGNQYLAHPQVLLLLEPYTLLLSCAALFACDALAERLDVDRNRRAILSVVEAVILWNVSVFWGHPEDAVAVAFALYAGIFALNQRWSGAGWLFGAAVAMQPLVIVLLPIVLVMGGWERARGLILRSVTPVVVITIPPLAANFHTTLHTLTSEPAFPRRTANHRTPWTSLAPKLGGRGPSTSIGGGPVRVVTLALAVLLGWWSTRWKNRPEMLIWAMALALALRCLTESVMTDYYVWPTLAVSLVVAAKASHRRFAAAVLMAIMTTVVAQWHLSEWPWWSLDVAGIVGTLVASWPSTSPGLGEGVDRQKEVLVSSSSRTTTAPTTKAKPRNNKAVARRGKKAGRR